MNSELEKMKSPIEYIKEAFKIYFKKENFIFFAKIMAVLTIASTSLSLVINYFYPVNVWQDLKFESVQPGIFFGILSLVAMFVGLWVQTTTYYSIFKMGDKEKAIFKLGFKNIFKYLFISLTLGVILIIGAVLLIIPAFIFGIWYSFSIFLVLDKNLSIINALKQSKIIVKGKFWKILGRTLVFGLFGFLIGLVVGMLPYVGSIIVSFLAPLFILPSYLLYRDLSAGLDDLGTV